MLNAIRAPNLIFSLGLREDFLENMAPALRVEEANEKGGLREFLAKRRSHTKAYKQETICLKEAKRSSL